MTSSTPDGSKKYFEITENQIERGINNHLQNKLQGYEKEKFESMKEKFSRVVRYMDLIASDLEEADKLGIIIKKSECKNRFHFDRFYNSHMKGTNEEHPIDFTSLDIQLKGYHAELQKIISEAKKGKTEELKAAL